MTRKEKTVQERSLPTILKYATLSERKDRDESALEVINRFAEYNQEEKNLIRALVKEWYPIITPDTSLDDIKKFITKSQVYDKYRGIVFNKEHTYPNIIKDKLFSQDFRSHNYSAAMAQLLKVLSHYDVSMQARQKLSAIQGLLNARQAIEGTPLLKNIYLISLQRDDPYISINQKTTKMKVNTITGSALDYANYHTVYVYPESPYYKIVAKELKSKCCQSRRRLDYLRTGEVPLMVPLAYYIWVKAGRRLLTKDSCLVSLCGNYKSTNPEDYALCKNKGAKIKFEKLIPQEIRANYPRQKMLDVISILNNT